LKCYTSEKPSFSGVVRMLDETAVDAEFVVGEGERTSKRDFLIIGNFLALSGPN
jgi:hypothetical protein